MNAAVLLLCRVSSELDNMLLLLLLLPNDHDVASSDKTHLTNYYTDRPTVLS